METVIFEDSPLATYLDGMAAAFPKQDIDFVLNNWPGNGDAASNPPSTATSPAMESITSSPSSQTSGPQDFAPRGEPIVQARYRRNAPQPLVLPKSEDKTVVAYLTSKFWVGGA
jgi:hypothetical protein